jgi:hypothetical protein
VSLKIESEILGMHDYIHNPDDPSRKPNLAVSPALSADLPTLYAKACCDNRTTSFDDPAITHIHILTCAFFRLVETPFRASYGGVWYTEAA